MKITGVPLKKTKKQIPSKKINKWKDGQSTPSVERRSRTTRVNFHCKQQHQEIKGRGKSLSKKKTKDKIPRQSR